MRYDWNRQADIGDWVSGRTALDERYHGFVVDVLPELDKVFVQVTASDHDSLVGQTIEGAGRSIELIPSGGPVTEGHLLNLIDLALNVKDEAWFEELSTRLRNLRKASGTLRSYPNNGTMPRSNRIFY